MDFRPATLQKPNPYKAPVFQIEPREWKILNELPQTDNLIIEVGCGDGQWICNQAKQNPHNLFIGIEKTHNKSKSLLNRALPLQQDNLRCLQADAIPLIHYKIPRAAVSKLYFFYPNPTPKKKQANNRFFVGSVFHVFDACLKTHGHIYLATNIKAYIDEAKDFLKNIWKYQIVRCDKINHLLEPRTTFEKKYHDNNENLFELIAEKLNGS